MHPYFDILFSKLSARHKILDEKTAEFVPEGFLKSVVEALENMNKLESIPFDYAKVQNNLRLAYQKLSRLEN